MANGCPSCEDFDLRQPIRQRVVATLMEKGFDARWIKKNEPFVLTMDEEELHIPIDLLVCVDARPALLIKCVNGHLASRERASLAMARLFRNHPIPFAIVANWLDAVVTDTLTGRTVGSGYLDLPGPSDVVERLRACSSFCLSDAQREREERILATYYHIRCDPPGEPY